MLRNFCSVMSCVAVVGSVCVSVAVAGLTEGERFFEAEVRPLLVEHCQDCHVADYPSGGLALDSLSGLLHGGDSGPAAAAGDVDGSLLVEAVRYEGYEMPPSGKLDDRAIAVFETWVAIGLPWPGAGPVAPRPARGPVFEDEDFDWWAIQPPERPAVPEIADFEATNPLDAFVERRRREAGLTAAPEAPRADLIRRLYFDLIGLPPTAEKVEAFVADGRPNAYERVVDRLLADPRHGERWARHWLDLVRYAEGDGYRADHFRPEAWRYRDYVIDSLNADKPYDRFVREQIAGDELYPGDRQAAIATGMLTHGIYEWNNRDAEGQRDVMLNEITDTVGDVFLGLGMQCARCHDHKFDAILQDDYFRLRSFFEPLSFTPVAVVAGETEVARYEGRVAVWRDRLDGLVERLEAAEEPFRRKAERKAVEMFPAGIIAMYDKPAEQRTPYEAQVVELVRRQVEYEFNRLDKHFKKDEAANERILELRRQIRNHKVKRPTPPMTARVARDVGPVAPPTVVPKKKREIEPGFLAVLNGGEAEAATVTPPGHLESTGRRSALANWLTAPENPFAARVIVNRVWAYHFGQGLAENTSDFGRLGGPPTHPELLDYLTTRFVDDGWSLKRLHRLIVTSATYRQSSRHPDADGYAVVDPENKLYWRADVRRLDAEQIRDAVLAATGRLDATAGGPSVPPDKPRRSIYTRVKRNSRDPLMEVFDLPLFFTSTSSRDTTTTPLQSLLLINSQLMLNHADALVDAVMPLSGGRAAVPLAVVEIWRRVLRRDPTAAELDAAVAFTDEQSERAARSGLDGANDVRVGRVPYRDGQAVVFERGRPSKKFRVDGFDLSFRDGFTVEAIVQINSVYKTGAVSTNVSDWGAGAKSPGWSFGVTGEGSRRKPRTLVMQLIGKTTGGEQERAILFSDHDLEPGVPYFVSVAVTPAGDGTPGIARFTLKDLANDEEPISVATVEHRVAGGTGNKTSLHVGRAASRKPAFFDGLIDDVRISRTALSQTELLLAGESAAPETIAYWRFETEPGISRDESGRGAHLGMDGGVDDRRRYHAGAVDLAHVLLNSSEFLYVR